MSAERLLDATLVYGRDPKLYAGKDRGSRRAVGAGAKGCRRPLKT
jgi:hypothetical protein